MNISNLRPEHCPVCGTGIEDDGASHDQPTDAPCPRCGHLLWYVSRLEGEVTVIHLVDNRVVVMELLDLLDHAVQDGTCGYILINFGSLQTVSSAALGKLVKLMSRAEAVRGKLKLCSLHSDLRHVLRITRLDRVFETYDTEAEALASFAPSHSLV
jgi:anti-sigma B factor antagonist